MPEYVGREAAVKAFNNFDAGRADSPPCTLLTPEEFAEYLYELPAADVVPVVHGWWKRYGRNLGECSNCGEIVNIRYNYCPNCGAKMDGGDNDEVD